MIDFKLLLEYLPCLAKGALISIKIAVYSCSIGIVIGTIFGLIQTSKSLLKPLITIYVTIIRGTPMLIQIGFAYFFLPNIGIKISAINTAIIAIGINSSAYICEVIRAGVLSIDRGQIEAAKVLGLNKFQIIRTIILPKTFANVLPSLGHELITLIKDSSLASTIGVVELFKEGKNIINLTYDALTIYFGISIIYLVITSTLSILIHYLEKKVKNPC